MYLGIIGPPNSAPINVKRLNIISAIAINAKQQKMVTENPKLPGLTMKAVPLEA